MTKLFMVSVMHTGTTSLMDLLKCGHSHTHLDLRPIMKVLDETEIIVAPLRDPKSVWDSFFIRNERESRDFWVGWAGLATLDMFYPIIYIPVDLPGIRDIQLNLLMARLGRYAVSPNWEPKGVYEGSRDVEIEPADLTPVYNLDLVRRYYRAET